MPEDRSGASQPYPNKEALKTYATFFFEKHRFLATYERADNLTTGLLLKTPDNTHYILYQESTEGIEVDLSSMQGNQPAVAVDTIQPYKEIALGVLSPEEQTLTLPHASDWVIAIGDYQD